MSESPAALPPELLRQLCRGEDLPFTTTAELEPLGDDGAIGQQRAIDALRFGIGMTGDGYNVFALGPEGIGKFDLVRGIVAREAASRPVPNDWCYVDNFETPNRPLALSLPPGRGRTLRDDLRRMVQELRAALPAAFRRDEFQARQEEIEEEFQTQQQQSLHALRERARAQGVMLIETPTGFVFAPIDDKGEAINPLQFEQLPADRQQRIKDTVAALQDELQRSIKQFPNLYREMHDKLKALQREMAEFTVGNAIEAVRERYADLPPVDAHLQRVQADIIDNVDLFLPHAESPLSGLVQDGEKSFTRYQVNLLIDNGARRHAPVEFEDLPTHGNLIGRSEYRAQMGTLLTDFTLITAGALHRANGGFLLLDARRVLTQPYAWEALKRVLRSREIRIETLERALGLVSTATLEPEPIPLDLKVVLIGDRQLFYLLQAYDPDFGDLFKVNADFDDRVTRDPATTLEFARLFAAMTVRHRLLPLARDAVAEAVEYAARLAADAERLSIHLGSISDLLREADYLARRQAHERIERDDVRGAIAQRIQRSDRLRARSYEEIERGTMLVATSGSAIGQINGLSVIQLGNFAFGQPSRITATTRLGDGKVIDIERETELGGAFHSKGVLILSNYLAAQYARELPLSLAASLAFEQSYGMVDGDSASLAELCALLSSLAEVPIRQCLAVTGSVNQRGEVQAIGGVNEKIEGFFDVCRNRGFAPGQGVVIPAANVKHLMLRHDVVDAAQTGTFQVFAVATVDAALTLLTGIEAGSRNADGVYPEDSVNGRVQRALEHFSRRRQTFFRSERGAARPDGNGETPATVAATEQAQ
ncbi:MAG: AAA family ATPase [Gammaproteobacteria bacterium]|nr:AAA family ATPase [Gammaproteobacteria bacterium]